MLELAGPKELVVISVKGQGRSTRLLTRSLRGIHARADLRNMADLATKLSNNPQTFLRDSLSAEEDTLFLNDLEEELVFFPFSYLCFFSAQTSENCGLLQIYDPPYRFRWLQEPFANDIHNIGAT